MSKHSRLIPVIFVSVFFFSLLSAQERVQETRLLEQASQDGEGEKGDPLGLDLFVYSRGGRTLFRLDGDREVPVLKPPFEVDISENIYDVQASRDGSLIVFGSGGATWHFPVSIHSVRPDGSQLKTLVQSGDDCDKFVWPGYGSHLCSFPQAPRISPDGQRVLFINEVHEWDEEAKDNLHHYYLSMVPIMGGSIVRLEEVGPGHGIAWSEDGASIYYYSTKQQGYDPWHDVPRRYDLETGRSAFLTDASWHVWPPGLAVSRGDNALYFIAKQGFVRLDPETGVAEIVSEERFDTFDLSPDGRRAVGIKEGDLTLIDLEFPSSIPLQVEPGAVDELALGQLPAARERWLTQRQRRATSVSALSSLASLASQARKAIGVDMVRWVDNERLWCRVGDDAGLRVGIAHLH